MFVIVVLHFVNRQFRSSFLEIKSVDDAQDEDCRKNTGRIEGKHLLKAVNFFASMDNFLSNVPFTTSGALVDIVDKKILVTLRDGKKFIGVLRSYDQFANLVLQDTIERIHVGIGKDQNRPCGKYADIWKGVFLVRGENVVLLGEIDLDKEDDVIQKCDLDSVENVMEMQKDEQEIKAQVIKQKDKVLFDRYGFGKEGDEGDRY
ncbi:hypothetical protein O181_042660 [Austropuccinia psidii MF-1]|uniref:U6 snRNA-associated Sm-like protein LSm1 n=1 Tax=Austropuccinia psidii MF-1 TaxID=1389203 RepID=A0A9Q3HIE3_9BASI|nr:hypothetical protein [Austropuccinia psidii MF-1]